MSANFEYTSELLCEKHTILQGFDLAAVNAELMPLVRMTAPSRWRDENLFSWPVQQPLFHSWVLLFGVLPVDLHRFCLESVDPASGFQEHSNTWMNRSWRHQRLIESTERGCRVTDRVQYESRLPLFGSLMRPVYKLVFRHRHRRLRRRYGAAPA